MSNETKWTPGPWVVSDEDVSEWGNEMYIIGPEGHGGATFVEESICFVECPEWNAKANAHLIAAAPELYEALESTTRELEVLINEVNEIKRKQICSTDLDPPDYIDHQTCHENSVLLAKARGES